ncbi:MAG: hypothetical protein FWF12_00450 [Betaproteobacteria bacterium]|nr:hypothetical protein [Betaproteobacteria bacterium]
MKLRLTAKGWETYTGQMGVIFFKGGLSVDDVLPVDAVRVAGVIGAEWENGKPANVSQIYLDNLHTQASSVKEGREPPAPVAPKAEPVASVATYTREQLADTADKEGIVGLRKIAEPFGIKGNSINGMIDAILKVSAAPKAE